MEWYSDPNKTTKVSQTQKRTKNKTTLKIYINLIFFSLSLQGSECGHVVNM